MSVLLDVALAVLGLSLALAGVNLLAIMGTWSLRSGHTEFMDAALVLAAISFVGTVAIANYLGKGRPVDDDRG